MTIARNVDIPALHGPIAAHLSRPEFAHALVIVAQMGPHTAFAPVTASLAARNYAILAVDLVTRREAAYDSSSHNVALLAQRLIAALDFARRDGDTESLRVGLFAADSAAAAAVRAAAQRDTEVTAVVVRGGLIDHAGLQYLEALAAPLLVLVDHQDEATEAAARRALTHVSAPHEVRLLNSADMAAAAAAWFGTWLR